MMNWVTQLLPAFHGKGRHKKDISKGLWVKCAACSATLYANTLEKSLYVCQHCDHHHRLPIRKRLDAFLDEGAMAVAEDVTPIDWLKFKDHKKYKDRLLAMQKQTHENEALLVRQGALCGLPVVVCGFEFAFIGGSMGSAVGECFVRAVSICIEQKVPLVCFSNSGGARMQEGLISLMQMAKTSAVLARLSKLGLPYISILLDPTMGGVSASLAMLGDIIIAEPKALIGFAGPRVIAQTVNQTLPEDFQRSEFLLQHGAIDMIVDRRHLRQRVAHLLAKLTHQTLLQGS